MKKIIIAALVLLICIVVGIAYSQPIVVTLRRFRDMVDTPSSYTGEAGNLIQVNVGETALEFSSITIGGGSDSEVIYNNGGDLDGDSSFTFNDATGVVTITGIGGSGLTGYDLKVGDTSTPDYGLIQTGDAAFGRVPYNAMSMDLDGSVVIRNLTVPATSNIEFAFLESGGTSVRFALAKSAAGNATYSARSMLIAGPSVWDDEIVTVGYWQTNNSIFDNLACDTSGDGADLAVQNDLEVEGDIFTDSIKESTSGAGVTFTGDISILNGDELRFNDVGSSNYVGFEAPALTANQIWVLPISDGDPGSVLTSDGFGALEFDDNASEKSWAFMSRDAGSGTNYVGGFYKFEASDNDFNPSVTFGTANSSYAAHFFLVQAAGASGGTDTVIRITGTTIDDSGNRITSVNVDLTVDDAGSAGTYYETTQKWLGQVTVAKQSGPDLLMNYGLCKYWDNNNTHFKVAGVEATWLGAKNDNTPDIILRHHKATGWTYNNAAAPTPPPAIASMATDHNTEIYIKTDEEGSWKRDNLSDNVHGEASEGILIELATTTNRTYAIGNFMVRITPFGDIDMIYENGDTMIYENGDTMIYN